MIRAIGLWLIVSAVPAMAANAGYCVNYCGNFCYHRAPDCFSACAFRCSNSNSRPGGTARPARYVPWGAFATAPLPSGAYGYSTDYTSQAQAERRALAECRQEAHSACQVQATFSGAQCMAGAIAWASQTTNLGTVVVMGTDRRQIEASAMSECALTRPGADCELISSHCAGD